jgi:hypothetical protein
MKHRDFFFCYNKALFKYLHDKNNIDYITIAINPHTKKTFSLFQIDDNFKNILNGFNN